MATHIKTGKLGEHLAAQWLLCRNYQILFRNFRIGRFEVDVIARKNGLLHLIEVKTSRSEKYGFPESRISKQKLNAMLQSAKSYQRKENKEVEIQVDVLSLIIRAKTIDYFLIERVV
jgi:putative endonuclease